MTTVPKIESIQPHAIKPPFVINAHNFKVFQVLGNGNKMELKAGDAKEFSMKEGFKIRVNKQDMKDAGTYFGGVCTIVAAVLTLL